MAVGGRRGGWVGGVIPVFLGQVTLILWVCRFIGMNSRDFWALQQLGLNERPVTAEVRVCHTVIKEQNSEEDTEVSV